MPGHREQQIDLDEQLRALDREYHFAAVLRTTHPEFLYTHFGPFDTAEEAYEQKELFKAELHKKLGALYWKMLPYHERLTAQLPIDRSARLAINKRIKELYSPDSAETET